MITRGFRKCGISVAVDGSEDEQINIAGLQDYAVDEDYVEHCDEDCDDESVDGDGSEDNPFDMI